MLIFTTPSLPEDPPAMPDPPLAVTLEKSFPDNTLQYSIFTAPPSSPLRAPAASCVALPPFAAIGLVTFIEYVFIFTVPPFPPGERYPPPIPVPPSELTLTL